MSSIQTRLPTRLPAAEYTAIIKPRFAASARPRPGVVLVLTPAHDAETEHIFYFSSWSYLRERLHVFGFASAEELDTVDVRLYTGKQPFQFASRRWEAPLIDTLDLSSHLP